MLIEYSYAERESCILNSDSIVVGLCSGVLPAAVAAASTGIAELLKLSIQVLSLSFNLAIETGRRSRQIEDSNGYWGYTIINLSPREQQEALDHFHKEKVPPPWKSPTTRNL